MYVIFQENKVDNYKSFPHYIFMTYIQIIHRMHQCTYVHHLALTVEQHPFAFFAKYDDLVPAGPSWDPQTSTLLQVSYKLFLMRF